MENIGLTFQKTYYKGIEHLLCRSNLSSSEKEMITSHFKGKNEKLLELTIDNTVNRSQYLIKNDQHSFKMRVDRSGLLIGTGNAHQTKNEGEGEFKLGMTFDYTSGLPYIPASSIKGVLRSFFEGKKEEYTRSLINDILNCSIDDVSFLENLKENMFNGMSTSEEASYSIYKRDLFFDAFPNVSSKNTNTRLFAQDVITPHKKPLKNPIPIEFMKVRAGVIFEFRFKLTNSVCNGIPFTAQNKVELFKQLLELGIGAKTNVGYGQLERIE